jgi:GT2 family glycosyltransferase
MKVAIIVLNWGSADYIPETLSNISALKCSQVQFEYYLVDNHSPMDLLRPLAQRFPQFVIIRNPSNYGLAEAYNVGIRRALQSSPEYIWTIGSDVIVNSVTITELLIAASKYRYAGILGPKVYQPSRKVFFAGGQLDWNQAVVTPRGLDQDDVGQFDFIIETDYVPYYCMLIRRQVIEQAGLFERRYFTTYFDVDYCQRAKNYHWKLMYVPLSQAVKTGQFDIKFTRDQSDYFACRNRLLISTKLGPPIIKISALRQSLEIGRTGTPWQRRAAKDFLSGLFGTGSVETA